MCQLSLIQCWHGKTCHWIRNRTWTCWSERCVLTLLHLHIFKLSAGLHVAQVCAIFNLPEELSSFPHPLVYVEWFTPLRHVDEHTQMFRVERSMQNHLRNASIIPITYISRSCHLIPYSGHIMDPTWTSKSAIEKCKSFHLNMYLRHIHFVLLCLKCKISAT